jgi:membrane-bound serine protease (ClpP class)
MERYGVSSGTIASLDGLLEVLGRTAEPEITRFEPSPADDAVALLTGSALTTLLILAGLVALFMEITTPGFGIPGTVAVICFSVVFLSNALLGTAGSMEILIFVVGVVLLLLEVFIIPGFGVAGISGIVLIGAALVLSRQDFFFPEFDWQWNVLRQNLLVVFSGVGLAFLSFVVIARFIPQIKPMRNLMLSTSQQVDQGFVVQAPETTAAAVGTRGVAVTTLRPAGKAELQGEVIPVESDGEFVEAGSEVEVIEVSGNRIVVRRC